MQAVYEQIRETLGQSTTVAFEMRFGGERHLNAFCEVYGAKLVVPVDWSTTAADARPSVAPATAYVAILDEIERPSEVDRDEVVRTAVWLRCERFCLLHAEVRRQKVVFQPAASVPLPLSPKFVVFRELPAPLFLVCGDSRQWTAAYANVLNIAVDEAYAAKTAAKVVEFSVELVK